MNWDELTRCDPDELFSLSRTFTEQFPPVQCDRMLTVGMAAHGNITTTLFALRALFASMSGTFELILVDDASPDETGTLFELVTDIHANTKVFRFTDNVEYSGSLNTILSHASGEQIIFISNDIFVTPAYIRQLLAVADRNPVAGIVRGCANFVDNGLLTHSVKDCGDLSNFDALFSYSANRAKGFADQTLDDPFLTGDAFLVSRQVLDAIGYLDPRFYGYFVDHDMGVRARQAGFNPQLALGAFAWHQHGANMDYLDQRAREEKLHNRWARVNENWARFKEKYNLPVSMAYQGVRRIPWDGLSARPLGEKILPCNHADFCLPQPGTDAWYSYRAATLTSQARKLMQTAQLDDAEKLCKTALDLSPECVAALTVLGSVQVYQGRVKSGLRSFRRAIRLDPGNIKAHSNLLLSMNYTQDCSQEALFKESRRWDELHCAFVAKAAAVSPSRSRIRIGYISPDFRRHSVGYFYMPLLENHNRNKFEIFCFSDCRSHDEVTRRMILLADGWRDISGLGNDEVEAVIREVAPDILVDLAGHTGSVIRLPLFARRLAPVQVSWVGYPNTTGMQSMDYRLTDAVADPFYGVSDRFCAEKLIRLAEGFLCYRPAEESPAVASLPAHTNGYITFGCFNMLPKIQDDTIAVWCALLHSTPNSRLILKNHYLRDNRTARRMVCKFAQYGIKSDQLILLPSDPDTASHLAHYNQVDIALDTFPYNGTTTTCEALWMGVPVITRYGDCHASRVGLSILTMLGHTEFAAETNHDYCAAISRLTSDPDLLQSIRQTLRAEMMRSKLCDGKSFARTMEAFFVKAVTDALPS